MGDKRIPLSEKNRDWLKSLKRGDDTYDDVLERLQNEDCAPDRTAVSNDAEVDTEALGRDLAERLREVREADREDLTPLDEMGELCDSVKEIEERTGRIERTVEELGGGR